MGTWGSDQVTGTQLCLHPPQHPEHGGSLDECACTELLIYIETSNSHSSSLESAGDDYDPFHSQDAVKSYEVLSEGGDCSS